MRFGSRGWKSIFRAIQMVIQCMNAEMKGINISQGLIVKKLKKEAAFIGTASLNYGVSDGVRTHDPQNHNLML